MEIKYDFLVNNDLKSTISSFVENLNLMESSRQNYKRNIKLFLNWIINQQITAPTTNDILRYKEYLENKGLSLFTVNSYLNSIKTFFRWLNDNGYYTNIASKIKLPEFPRNKFYKRHLTATQIKQLLRSIDKRDLKGMRDFSMINLMCRTGVRSVEIGRANVEDIKIENEEVRLYLQGKGCHDKNQFVTLTESAHKPIEKFLQTRFAVGSMHHCKDPLFPSLGNRNKNGRLTPMRVSIIVKEYLKQAGFTSMKGISSHSLRHTFATLAMQGGSDILSVARSMRHSNPNTTKLYDHSSTALDISPEKIVERVLDNSD